MMQVLARNWWALALRGVIALLFGIIAFVYPGMALAFLVALFGIFAILDGALTLVAAAWAAEAHMRWWPLVISGLASLVVGILAYLRPGVTALVLLYFIAAWAVIIGVFTIAAAVRLRREIEHEWLLGINGALSVLFGLILFARPGAGALAVLWIIGAYAVAFGVLSLMLAFRLRGMVRA